MIRFPFVAARFVEFLSNRRMIVDLSVERDAHIAGGIRHGLRRGSRKVDDGQTPMAKNTLAVRRRPHACSVRASMRHAIPHRCHNVHTGGGSADRRETSRYSTHDAQNSNMFGAYCRRGLRPRTVAPDFFLGLWYS